MSFRLVVALRIVLPSFCMGWNLHSTVSFKHLFVVADREVSFRTRTIVLLFQLREGREALTVNVAIWTRTASNTEKTQELFWRGARDLFRYLFFLFALPF